MELNDLFIGNNKVITEKPEVSGQFVQIGDEKFYQIKHFDTMKPFFISLASESNHWMYISSTGGLTAGRKNPDLALFPYYTDDKIMESGEITGSKTILHVVKSGKRFLWEPFSDRNQGIYKLERTILKSTIGNKLIFSEKNIDLGLTFNYAWMNADDFGWIKKSWLINETEQPIEIHLVDGLQNILPFGVDIQAQGKFSTLVDAYKKTELIKESNLALFRMEAIMVDRAEPSEALRVNTIWNYGLDNASFLLSSGQLDNFRQGKNIVPEIESKGVRGAFFACSSLVLEALSEKSWYFVVEVEQDAVKVNNLIEFIKQNKNLSELIEKSIKKGTDSLLSIIAETDGIQHTADENKMARHFANVLFNTMRGGLYSEGYMIYASYFNKHIKHFNIKIWEKYKDFLSKLPEKIEYSNLESLIAKEKDENFYRLFLEYLPLTFSRRHGDPSRPWNLFNIRVKDENGNKLLSYQGNWRDIFQNWEALSLSYPSYINGIIAKFLNASTADGYNPYKVTSEGIDWEVIEPDNPWSNIGYWGDHQIIYLLKLMELSRNHSPEALSSWLNKELFAFANVPYELKSYEEIVANPKNSIRFNDHLHKHIESLEPTFGADAKLILDSKGEVMLVSFTEKILATLLSKLSNFIPEAGIWMNTLRPEWNDANNALVGNGASMVTLYYMRRFLAFAKELYQNSKSEIFNVSEEILGFCESIDFTFTKHIPQIGNVINDTLRRTITDELGKAGEIYRSQIYKGFSGKKKTVTKNKLIEFYDISLSYIDQSINANKRSDNLYHSYNLVSFSDGAVSIRHLYEMLEGQVAVLSSGKLTTEETLELLKSLKNSSLYRQDQESYILYPNKQLPNFLEKNLIPNKYVQNISLLNKLVESGNTSIITKDNKGLFHFNASFNSAGFLKNELEKLKNNSSFEVSDSEQQAILGVYEKMFDHQSFTGRSGTFYKYEGLGSIYWHMVSKLLLSVGESIKTAVADHAKPEVIKQLENHFAAIQKGIGAHKSPKEYGSFPFDPYSHTPIMAGVQQPGMTGQVKEDIITRFFELGLTVHQGQLTINPIILKKSEFLQPTLTNKEYKFPYLDFTYCSIKFVYLLDNTKGIDIINKNEEKIQINGYSLNILQSQLIFNRDKNIKKVVVHFNDIFE